VDAVSDLTRADMEWIVGIWIPMLGLSHWEINIDWEPDDDEFDSPHKQAYTWRARDYDTARVCFNPTEFPKWSREKAHQVVVHELLHLVTRDVEFILDNLEGMLHRDVDKLIDQTFHHHLEGAIDRLAYRIVEIAGVDKPKGKRETRRTNKASTASSARD
jgi:hypothetical protein